MDAVRERLEGTGVDVVGVINAGAKAALDNVGSTAACAVGVLATPGTIASGAYERTILAEAASRGLAPGTVTVVSQSGYGFAESVDCEKDYADASLTAPRASYRGPRLCDTEGAENVLRRFLLPVYNFDESKLLRDPSGDNLQLNDASCYARFNFVCLVEKHRQSGNHTPLKVIILGCTHYPYQLQTLRQCASQMRDYNIGGEYPYRDLIAEDLIFIDPAQYTAEECAKSLESSGKLGRKRLLRSKKMKVDAWISVPAPGLRKDCLTSDGAFTYEFKYGRSTLQDDTTFVREPFSLSNVDSLTRERIREKLPLCSGAISFQH